MLDKSNNFPIALKSFHIIFHTLKKFFFSNINMNLLILFYPQINFVLSFKKIFKIIIVN